MIWKKKILKVKKINKKNLTKKNFKKIKIILESQIKNLSIRYIIFEPENREVDINNIDEEYDYRVKLLNPFRSYMTEGSDKIKKQAFDQIMVQINPEKKKKERNSVLNKDTRNSIIGIIPSNSSETIALMQEIEALQNKFNQSIQKSNEDKENNNKTKENFEQFMKFFKDSCEVNNIKTVDQKIDYFVYMRNMNLKKEKEQSKKK
jgi:hypothetical protein